MKFTIDLESAWSWVSSPPQVYPLAVAAYLAVGFVVAVICVRILVSSNIPKNRVSIAATFLLLWPLVLVVLPLAAIVGIVCGLSWLAQRSASLLDGDDEETKRATDEKPSSDPHLPVWIGKTCRTCAYLKTPACVLLRKAFEDACLQYKEMP